MPIPRKRLEKIARLAKELSRPNENIFVSNIVRQRFMYTARDLAKTTHFTEFEIEGLLWMFRRLEMRFGGFIEKTAFQDILFNFFGFNNDRIVERIYRVVRTNANQSHLSCQDWVLMLSIFLRGTLEERAEYAFKVYCPQNSSLIEKEAVLTFFRNSYILKSPDIDTEEFMNLLTETFFRLFQCSRNHQIDKKSFISLILEEPCLLDVLGECLPSMDDINALEMIFSEKLNANHAPFSYISNKDNERREQLTRQARKNVSEENVENDPFNNKPLFSIQSKKPLDKTLSQT